MATTTTNYGFDIPQSTDLVKDGATAIATLGQDIDTAMNTALGTKKAGMVLLNTTSFSGVASISLPANTFTSTYTNYRIMFQNISPANSLALSMRLRTSGSDNSTSNYDSAFLYAQSTTAYASASDNASSFGLTASSGARIISTIDLMNPQTADDTLMVHSTYQTTSDSGTYNVGGGRFQLGTSFDSATFIANSVNLLTGQVQVYGYSK